MAWSVSTYGGVGASGDASPYAGICDVINCTAIGDGSSVELRGLAAAATGIGELEAAIGAANSSMDWMWLLLGGALVFFMHSGFALLEVGSVSVRNTQVTLCLAQTLRAPLCRCFPHPPPPRCVAAR